MEIPEDILDFNIAYGKYNKKHGTNKKLYLVGGCVRDNELGLGPKDYDLATDAMPDEVAEILSMYVMNFTGKSFGVMRVYTLDDPKGYEIATFRQDLTSGRNPLVKLGVTLEEDAWRRDFTINAMYFDLVNLEVIDVVGGKEDLKNGIIRAPGVPKDRFRDDKLRIMRAIRFASKYGFSFDEHTWQAIVDDNSLIGPNPEGIMVPISHERIVEEFLKGLAVNAYYYLTILKCANLYPQIFPGLKVDTDRLCNSNKPEVVIANLLHANRPSMLEFALKDLHFSGEISKGVFVFVRLTNFGIFKVMTTGELLPLRKKLPGTNINKRDIYNFADTLRYVYDDKWVRLMKAFADFQLTVTGDQLELEGYKPGEEMGKEITKREIINFDKHYSTYEPNTV